MKLMPARMKIFMLVACLIQAFPGMLSAQLKFIENRGQWPEHVSFRAEMTSSDLWLTDSGIWLNAWEPDATERMHDRALNQFSVKAHAIFFTFTGGDFRHVRGKGEAYPEQYNYFKGNDARKWSSGVKAWPSVLVENLYPGVDLEIFEQSGTLKYNIICKDEAAISRAGMIQWVYRGADSLRLTDNRLIIHTSLGSLTESMPRVWGEGTSGQEDIPATYELEGQSIRFNPGNQLLNRKFKKLIIDPILVFSTFSGSRADNFGCTGTYDEWGNAYAGGTVFDFGLPVTAGAYQRTFGGGRDENLGYGDGRDAAILKFSPDGRTLIYCTYLGGENNEQPHSMVADGVGNLYIMGSTRSNNFPVTAGAYMQAWNGDYDFFVTCLNPSGTALIASTYFGSSGLDAVGANRELNPIDDFPLIYNYADEFRGEIITDDTNIYVAGMTYSPGFPRSNNSGWFGGREDAVVFSLSANLRNMRWSQVVGSTGYEAFYGIALGKNGDLYASGGSSSNDLQSRFSYFKNAYQGGMADGIICRLRKSDGGVISGRHVGTVSYDQGYFAQSDNSGNPFMFGQTEGSFPIINAPYNQPGRGQFIVRLNPDLSAVTMSTTFGANSNQPNISPSAFLVDRCERIFVSGWGGTTNDALYDVNTGRLKIHRNIGNTRNLQVTADAAQRNTDGSDFYIAVFSRNMLDLAYATFFGGISTGTREAEEHVDGGTSRFDKKGIIYQSACGGCRRNGLFPTTPGAYSRSMNSNNCNNAMFKIDFENLNRKPFMRDTFMQVIATESIDLTVTARDPDPYDTLLLRAFRVRNGGMSGADTARISLSLSPGSASMRFTWNTTCTSHSSDTVIYRIMVYDRGCPQADTTWATVKLLVTPPPVVIPPDAVCVSFDRQTGLMNISWKATIQPARFFKFLLLDRIDPQGRRTTLDTIRNWNDGTFTDRGVIDPAVNNYCYLLVGVNICGTRVEIPNPFCTVNELNTPIAAAPVKFATVDFDKRVRVEWEQSREQDFKEFEVYRYPRGGSPGKIPVHYTQDTFYLDSSLNVDAESFCYTVLVADKCGHISKPGGEACNVVLSGTATGRPQYHFDLGWQDYQSWNNGVLNWFVERQYASRPWEFLGNTGTTRSIRDDKLDFDWGGYWYRVTAVEDMQGTGRSPYTSQSNWIYLYQPPELWVPNAFTRNADMLNDTWGTVPVFVRNYHMRVYDRWGQKVWESTDKKRQWDGTVNDRKAPDGVYAWYVIFDGWDDKTYRMKGTVTILH